MRPGVSLAILDYNQPLLLAALPTLAFLGGVVGVQYSLTRPEEPNL
jgi:hypothetical protein